tara:strand:- start:336 stop:545 length:210 start_codon:yes stop_codon:yes gene_type:complete
MLDALGSLSLAPAVVIHLAPALEEIYGNGDNFKMTLGWVFLAFRLQIRQGWGNFKDRQVKSSHISVCFK